MIGFRRFMLTLLGMTWAATAVAEKTVLVEAESFAELGGWVIDQQAMDQMGSPFLLAGGIVGIILTGAKEKAHRMYALDLLGAGVGAIADDITEAPDCLDFTISADIVQDRGEGFQIGMDIG